MTGRLLPKRRLSALILLACALPGLCAAGDTTRFRMRSGSTLITNVPEKFRGRPDYVELNLDSIKVEDKYVRRDSDLSNATKAEVITHYARRYGVNENLVYAVIQVESKFNSKAVSKAGARGLMQLMPGTAAEMGVKDIFDVAQNIAGGTQYLSKMLDIFNQDMTLALAAYNAGPSVVKHYGGVPPYTETKEYVVKVKGALKKFQFGGKRHKLDSLARVAVSVSRPTSTSIPRAKTKDYLIKYKSGLTQPIDDVEDKGSHWLVIVGRRSYWASKDIVDEIISMK